MITTLISTMIGWGVPAKFAKPLLALVAFLSLIGLFFGAKALYDRSVIAKHDLKVEAQQAKDDKKADNKAADQRVKDVTRLEQEQKELERVIISHNASADDRRRAFYRCLRLQQDARSHGKQPPTCS
jgi:hypothetical protein